MSGQFHKGQGSAGAVVLGGRYQILPDKPLPELNSPMANAVAASDRRSPGREMFALICRTDVLPRIDVIPQFSRLSRHPIVTPVEAGPVPWPETGGRRFVVVFDRNFGERVCQSSDKTVTPLSEDRLVRTVIAPLTPALKELGVTIGWRLKRENCGTDRGAGRPAVHQPGARGHRSGPGPLRGLV